MDNEQIYWIMNKFIWDWINPALRAELQALHILDTEENPGGEEDEEREMEAQGEEEAHWINPK